MFFLWYPCVQKSINDRELRDDPEIEQRLRAENDHCKMAGAIGLDRSNFKTSYSAELCPDFHKYYERSAKVSTNTCVVYRVKEVMVVNVIFGDIS